MRRLVSKIWVLNSDMNFSWIVIHMNTNVSVFQYVSIAVVEERHQLPIQQLQIIYKTQHESLLKVL